ncbi:MAG: undecaprenyl/decaprenyl-phosphate alpha-N-acetylglucosaminyl 1-phosphate transferase [Anaerolineales bacterium]|nr:undecaprenyl/decaprenyl-phosphate alpha-N-acetylglucosaminyl 1-phosphate transferase [Anaerolineales bacterium]
MDAYLPLIIFSFLAAFVATPVIGRVAFRTGFVDAPKPHKMHVRPMPLLGGLAIYLALCAVLLRVDFSTEVVPMAAVAVGATLLMLVGLWDDRRGVSPRVKLLAQIAAAVLAAAAGIQVRITPFPAVNFAVTLFWFVGITNAINLMDNMDGLAAGICSVAALFFTILAASARQGLVASLAAAVTGASLGFLYYNISPAMIFMGDTGSLLLGFLLAVIGVEYSPTNLPLGSTWMAPIVVLGLPIFDTTLVTFSRLFNRRPVSRGGTDHTSHRLARLGLGINRAVFSMYLAAGLLGILAVLMTRSRPETAVLMFAGLLVAGLIGLAVLERARPIPLNNPLILILAEDEQGVAAVKAARMLSENLVVAASPRASRSALKAYLRALALEGEAFAAWMDSGIGEAIGQPQDWHRLFRLAGKLLPFPDGLETQKVGELFREAHLIVFCRGAGWPEEIRKGAAEFSGRLLAAPGAELACGAPTAEGAWADPPALARALEETMLGVRRKDKPS